MKSHQLRKGACLKSVFWKKVSWQQSGPEIFLLANYSLEGQFFSKNVRMIWFDGPARGLYALTQRPLGGIVLNITAKWVTTHSVMVSPLWLQKMFGEAPEFR